MNKFFLHFSQTSNPFCEAYDCLEDEEEND